MPHTQQLMPYNHDHQSFYGCLTSTKKITMKLKLLPVKQSSLATAVICPPANLRNKLLTDCDVNPANSTLLSTVC